MSELDPVALGGLAPASEPGDGRVPVVPLRLRHPALPGSVVVRLVPEALVPGERTRAGLAGFVEEGVGAPVAQGRRRAVGFPDQPLLSDPKNGRYALAVLKEFQAAARKMGTKPGHARDELNAVAKELGRGAPHFLPSFWEEAARAFAAVGATSFAATAFENARAAERQHALKVDEAEREEAFLEFSLVGAVPVKSLQAWIKEVRSSAGPAAALDRFRRMVVRRTLGGLAPWAGLAKELRELAKAAGVSVEAEEEALLRAVLHAPSLKRAPAGFWRELAGTARRLAGEPEVAAVFARLVPEGYDDGPREAWLANLLAWGVVDRIAREGLPGGIAAWLGLLFERCDANPARVLEITKKVLPRLVAEGAPVPVFGEGVWRLETLDAMEALLAGGATATVGNPEQRFDLAAWAGQAGERVDPVHVAAHPVLGPMLTRGVEEALDEAEFQAVAPGKSAFREARRAHFLETAGKLATAGLPGADEASERIAAVVDAASLAEFPEVGAAIQAADVAAALARTLVIGLYDELCWPDLEAARAELGSTDDVETVFVDPWAVVHNDKVAIVVGPKGREGRFELKLPKGARVVRFRYADGRLLAVWRDPQDIQRVFGRWSGEKEARELDFPFGWRDEDGTPPWAGGGVLSGGRRLRAGDTTIGVGKTMLDGEGVWADIKGVTCAVDPESGTSRGPDVPLFLRPRGELKVFERVYHPLYWPASPLTAAPGAQYGWVAYHLGGLPEEAQAAWLAEHAPGARGVGLHVGIGFDGRAVRAEEKPRGLLRVPGADTPRVIEDVSWSAPGFTLDGVVGCDLDEDGAYVAGAKPLPVSAWHALRPRDEAGSRWLRSCGPAEARALLDAVAGFGEVEDERLDEVAAKMPAALGDPMLRRAVARVALHAASVERRLAKLREGPSAAPGVNDDALKDALTGLVQAWGAPGSSVADLAAADRWLAGEAGPPTLAAELPWWDWLAEPGALVYVGWSPATSEPERAAIAGFLQAVASSGFAGAAPGVIRRVCVTRTAAWLPWRRQWGSLTLPERWAGEDGGVRFVAAEDDTPDEGDLTVRLLQRAGAPTPTGAVVLEERPAAPDGAWLRRVLAGFGPRLPVDAAARQALVDATGLTLPEAAAVLAGLRELSNWSSDPLGAPARALLGLKLPEARLAQEMLSGVDRDKRRAAFHAAVAGLDDGVRVPARLGAAWAAVFGVRAPVDVALLAAAKRSFPVADGPECLLALASLGTSPAWNVDGAWQMDADGDVVRTDGGEDPPAAFDGDALLNAVGTLCWLYAEAPGGDPLRARLPEALARLRARLANPRLLLTVVRGEGKGMGGWFKKQVGSPFPLARSEGEDEPNVRSLSTLKDRGVYAVRSGDDLGVAVCPAEVDDATLDGLAKLVADDDNWHGRETWAALRFARSPGLAAMVAAVPGEDGAPQDPRRSAPATVAQVVAAQGLSEDAATLYLQLLALPAPTKADCLRWNEWRPKAYEAAGAELLGKELVLEAKRARAGRELFLPGGWQERKSGPLPLEEWKLPLYGGEDRPFEGYLPVEPFGALFTRAWARVAAGDRPRYERGRKA